MRFHGFRPNPPTTQTRTPEDWSLANRLAMASNPLPQPSEPLCLMVQHPGDWPARCGLTHGHKPPHRTIDRLGFEPEEW